jgi:hypothetical protein
LAPTNLRQPFNGLGTADPKRPLEWALFCSINSRWPAGLIDVLRLTADRGGMSRRIHASWSIISVEK